LGRAQSGGNIPRQEFFEAIDQMIADALDDVGKEASGSRSLSFAVPIRLYMAAARSPCLRVRRRALRRAALLTRQSALDTVAVSEKGV
jgi:hypothetical protein